MTDDKRWVELWDDEEYLCLTDIPGFHFLDYELLTANVKTNEVDIEGLDGVMIGSNTLEPFGIELNFYFEGIDRHNLNLFSEQLRSKIRRRDAFYLRHSYMRGIKYAINSVEVAYEKLNHADAEVTMTFNCYKGYGESYRDTDKMDLLQEESQFQQGMEITDNMKYEHNERTFSIFNGSTETINPILGHKLIIQMSLEAPNGFTIHNKTTGDKFTYKKKINKFQNFTLNGVYPYVDKKRVGIDTNYSYIRLQKGKNNISIEGDGVEKVESKFIFNFIYR